MVKTEIIIGNDIGIESKTAAIFIQKATNYKASVWIEVGEKRANAKSLLGLLSLGLAGGSKIILMVDGEDEVKASQELSEFVVKGFEG